MPSPVFVRRKYSPPSELRRDDLDLHVWALVVFLVIMGGFTAGCNAGHVSHIWPLIFGRLIPPGLLSHVQPAALNLVDALLTVAFIHRWLAFIGLIAAIVVHRIISRINTDRDVLTGIGLLFILVVLQIVLGFLESLSGIQIALALLHQANANALFASSVYLLHRLRAVDQQAPA